MCVNNLSKKSAIAFGFLLSTSLMVNAQEQKAKTWIDLSDPRAVYTGVKASGGSEGVNVSANYGGYLNGQYKHKITVEAKNNLDYYNVDYMLINANTGSGFTIETTWDRDVWDIKDVNDISFGVFAKIPLLDGKLNIHPKFNLGMLWKSGMDSTSYAKFDASTRFSINRMFWVGITPTYTYTMKGYDVSGWETTIDGGIQISDVFAVAAHVNNDDEYWFDVIFAF